MGKIRKVLALVIAMVVTVMMVATVFAAVETGDASITITRDPSYTDGPNGTGNPTGNEDYTYYRILFATYADNDLGEVDANTGELTTTGKVAYYVTDATEAGYLENLKVKDADNNDVALFTVTPSTDSTRYNVTLAYPNATGEQIAAALDTIKEHFPTATVTRDGANAVEIEDVAKGYYLITSTLGSKLAVQTLGDVTIKEKNTYPTVDKKQDDETTPEYADDAVHVKVGDTVYYQLTVKVPATANGDITLTDTMSTGLTYDAETGLTWSVNEGTISLNTDYAVDTAATGETWKARIHATNNTKGKTITITYQATVNANALTETDKKNEITLKYSNYTQKDEVYYDTSATGMIKYDGDKAEVKTDNTVGLKNGQEGTFLLKGAEFKLQVKEGENWADLAVYKDASGYYRPSTGSETAATITSDDNGEVIIRGLDGEKQYQLVETKVPADGYNLATAPVSLTLTTDAKKGVTISGNDSETVTKLEAAEVGKLANNKGAELPSTGGMGTTIFYVIGGLLVLAAAIVLISRKRVQQ